MRGLTNITYGLNSVVRSLFTAWRNVYIQDMKAELLECVQTDHFYLRLHINDAHLVLGLDTADSFNTGAILVFFVLAVLYVPVEQEQQLLNKKKKHINTKVYVQ